MAKSKRRRASRRNSKTDSGANGSPSTDGSVGVVVAEDSVADKRNMMDESAPPSLPTSASVLKKEKTKANSDTDENSEEDATPCGREEIQKAISGEIQSPMDSNEKRDVANISVSTFDAGYDNNIQGHKTIDTPSSVSTCCSTKLESGCRTSNDTKTELKKSCCSGTKEKSTKVVGKPSIMSSCCSTKSEKSCGSKDKKTETADSLSSTGCLAKSSCVDNCCGSTTNEKKTEVVKLLPSTPSCSSTKAKSSCCSITTQKDVANQPPFVSSCCSTKAESDCGSNIKQKLVGTTDSSSLVSSCCSTKSEGSCGTSANSKKTIATSSCCSSKTESGCGSTTQEKKSSSQPGPSCCSSQQVRSEPLSASKSSCCSGSSSCSSAAAPPSLTVKIMDTPICNSLRSRAHEFRNERGMTMAKQQQRDQKVRSPIHAMHPMEPATLRLCIVGMTCSGCCTRIEQYMHRQPGIVDVNISLLTSRGIFQYDPSVLSAKSIEDMVTNLGFIPSALPDESSVSIVFHVEGHSLTIAKKTLFQVDGIKLMAEIDDDLSSSTIGNQKALLVEYDPEQIGARSILQRISSALGFQPQVSSPQPQAIKSEAAEARKFTHLLKWSCILSLPVLVVEYIFPLVFSVEANPASEELISGLSYRDIVGFLCATPILFVIAAPIHESAFSALRYTSRVTMDVLISLSSISAYIFSLFTVLLEVFDVYYHRSETFFEVTVMLITLIMFGRYIEKKVKAKASNSVNALLQIQAKTAILLEDSGTGLKESYIDILLVERQDLLKVLPGARVPTDGVVVEGSTTIDESMITGESRKVTKESGSVVIGGTVNSQGVFTMRVTHTVTESMLARIVHLVDEAQGSKCASQNIADVVSSYFTTFIICTSIIMFFVWYYLAIDGVIPTHGLTPFPFALRFAITVLVISCPCAISLAVPTAIMVATTIGSQFGVLFKGGQALEALDKVNVVMFDKTGTLTCGNLSVVDIHVGSDKLREGYTKKIWSYVASIEANSEHSIGKALVSHTKKLDVPIVETQKFESVPGCGVQCHVDGSKVALGSLKWLQDVLKIEIPREFLEANASYQHRGCVVIFVAIDGEAAALIALKDIPRPEARLVIDELKRRKIQTWIVTGDQQGTALSIAQSLGIHDVTVIADALPHQKVDKVRILQSIGKNVAFVGDGVNDAPALALANVGIAIGAGTDVAIDSADLVLVKDNLWDLLNAMELSRATNRMIRMNLSWGFMYNLLMMPLACGALYPLFGISIPPAFAGLSELLSSVPVILFSLLLNWWRPPFDSANGLDSESFVAIDIHPKARETTPLLHTK